MKTVYGRATSSNVQAVMWCLAELGIQADRLDYGHVHGKTDTPEYGAMNPNRLVPVLKDGELVLWESAAIVRYLAATYGDDAFWPGHTGHRARLDMWAEWIKTTFAPVVNGKVFWTLVRTPADRIDHAALAADVAAAARLAGMLDARIGAGPFLDGDALSFADIMAGHLLYRYYTLDFERAATPNLDAYYRRLCERDAYRSHVMVSYDTLRVA